MIQRGAVRVTFDPVDVHWNDRRVPLSPLEAQLFALVVRRGRASWSNLNTLLAESGARLGSRDVLIYRIRRKFGRVGAINPLETVRTWGLRFCAEQDANGHRTIVIGGSEDSD